MRKHRTRLFAALALLGCLAAFGPTFRCGSDAVADESPGLTLPPDNVPPDNASPATSSDTETAAPAAKAVAVKDSGPTSVTQVSPDSEPVTSIEAARAQARVLLQVYSSTLDVMHDHYFHANRAVLPARAMEDVFAQTADPIHAKARWIAVNAKAMSVDHEPADAFEREAARRIAAGDKAVEAVIDETYRFAGSIPLHASCVQCHTGSFGPPSKKARFAGLIINIPLSGYPAE